MTLVTWIRTEEQCEGGLYQPPGFLSEGIASYADVDLVPPRGEVSSGAFVTALNWTLHFVLNLN